MESKLDATRHSVLLAYIPDWTREKADELRDHIVESMGMGVGVVPADLVAEVRESPDLGGVTVWGGCDNPLPEILAGMDGLSVTTKDGLTYVEPEAPKEPELLRAHNVPAAEKDKSVQSKVAAEKQAILARLKQYREDHGPGCLDAVAKKAGHGITPEMLRDLCIGAVKLLIEDWRHIGKALDKLEDAERKAAGNG